MTRKKVDLNSLPSNNMEPVDKDISVVTTGRIKTRKGGGLANEVRTIGNSLFEEIILPAVKSAVVDFFSNGVNMIMFGRESTRPRGDGRHTAYNRMHKGRQRSSRNRRSSSQNIRQTEEIFEDIFFDERHDAENTLGRMMELTAEYGWATIGDLYSLVGLSSNYTHERYGWDDLRRCRIQFTTEGYVIDLPDPEYLK